MSQCEKTKKKVLIVGAGAAGMACAATLARHPEQFDVTLIERESWTGGNATSIDIDKEKWGANYMNDRVQGGTKVYANTFRWLQELGYKTEEVNVQIAFGKGVDGFWTNAFPTQLVDKYQKDIKKFGFALRIIRRLEFIFAFIPVCFMLWLLRFSKGFGDQMIYPLMCVFFGNGNRVAYVSTAMLGRLFYDPNIGLWSYDEKTLLPNLPKMSIFPKLGQFYSDWTDDIRKRGVDVRLNQELEMINERTNEHVIVTCRSTKDNEIGSSSWTEIYDDLVLCVLAEDAKRLLGSTASWLERAVLGSVPMTDDVTVIHNDIAYMEKYYENYFKEDLALPLNKCNDDDKIKINCAKETFRPLYYTHTYTNDPKRLEMTFNCSFYQRQFPKNQSFDKSLFISVFLDKKHAHLWTHQEICKDKILSERHWHSPCQDWSYYVRVVPWMMFLQGKRRVWYAGAWELASVHEIAITAGMSVAYRLGADYPFLDEPSGMEFFKKFVLLNHGKIFRAPH